MTRRERSEQVPSLPWDRGGSDDIDREVARAQVRNALFPTEEDVTVSFGRYRVLRRLGEGGMGVVYLAHDPELRRDVALKVLHSTAKSSDEAREQRHRLRREAALLGQLSHPNVVEVYDIGHSEDGRTHIAMEYIDGGTLRGWRDGRGRDRIVDAYLEAARGLAAVHATGILHRDFKPDNVLVGRNGRIVVSDFGLARLVDTLPSPAGVPSHGSGPGEHTVSTRTGVLHGTPGYLAPELLDGRPASAASDQFALCISLFEALLGSRPFHPHAHVDTATWANFAVAERRRLQRLPPAVRQVLVRGLRPEPTTRYPDVRALIDALEQARDPTPRRRFAITLGLGTVLAAALALRSDPAPPHDVCHVDDPAAWIYGARDAQAVEASLTAALPGTTQAAAVHDALQARARAWGEQVTAACTAATPIRQRARLQCLDARQHELQAMVSLLGSVDAEHAAASVDLALSHGGAVRCDDERAEHAGRPHPPAMLEPAVAAGRARLARASLQISLGEFKTANHLATSVAAYGHRLGFGPLELEAAHQAARVAKAQRHRPAAIEGFRGVERRAHALPYPRIALAAGVELLELLVDERVPPAVFDPQLERTRRLANTLGDDVAVVEVESMRAEYERRLGNPQRGLRFAQAALALAELRLGPDHPEAAYAHDYVSGALTDFGRYDEALEHKRRAIAILERAYGADGLGVSVLLSTAGNVARLAGRHEQAAAWHRRALGIVEHHRGPQSPRLIDHLGAAARTALARGHADAAIDLLQRKLRLEHATDASRFTSTRALIDASVLAGRLQDAATRFDKALGDLESAPPWDRSETWLAGARVALRQGDPSTAIERATTSLRHTADAPLDRVLPNTVLVRAWLQQGHTTRAAEALQAAQSAAGDNPYALQPAALAELRLAELALTHATAPERAPQAHAQARRAVERAYGPQHPRRRAYEMGHEGSTRGLRPRGTTPPDSP